MLFLVQVLFKANLIQYSPVYSSTFQACANAGIEGDAGM